MSDNSPYVIRLELLKLADSILNNQNMATQERLRMDWDHARGSGLPFPELPVVSTEDVVAQAKILNDFVSSKS